MNKNGVKKHRAKVIAWCIQNPAGRLLISTVGIDSDASWAKALNLPKNWQDHERVSMEAAGYKAVTIEIRKEL